MKKEIMIKIISGANIHKIFLKNIVIDMLFYIILFAVSIFILASFTNVLYCFSVTILCFSLFLIINSLLYCKLYKIDYKSDIATNASAKNALRMSYILKTITVIIMLAAASGNIGIVMQGINFYRQRNFFEDHREFDYVTISSRDFEETLSNNRKFYKDALDKGNTLSLVNCGTWVHNVTYILADSGAVKYLSENVTELKEADLTEKVFFILPDHLYSDTDIKKEMLEVWESYYKGAYEYELIQYAGSIDIMGIENIGNIESTLISNPVIILNHMSTENMENYWNIGYIANSTLYSSSAEEWLEFITAIGYGKEIHYRTNALDNYIYQWQFVKRNMYAGIVLFALLLLLESIIITTILRFEYSVNATELSLKKVFGYSIYERQKKIFMITAILGFISMIFSLIVCTIFDLSSVVGVLICGVAILLLECIFITFKVRKTERLNIQRILKGERI